MNIGRTSDPKPGGSVTFPIVPWWPWYPSKPGPTQPISAAGDPNQLTGPAGFGANGFLSGVAALNYRIDFENTTNATAPAQQVILTDQLSTNFDWSTFTVSEVGFGDLLIALPPSIQHFETNIPVSLFETHFEVQVEVGIQPNSGQMYANFRSIDPNTSLPPPVNIGFLPPEDGTGRGQGHITYSIRAMPGLATGTQLRNVALISFDNQQAIATDQVDDFNPAAGTDPAREALITLDSAAPTSHVLPLPAQSQSLQFPVSWTSQDDPGGSGVAAFDVYVSDNGGLWVYWQSLTTSTNAIFKGQPHHTYGFCSIAHDNAGNVELPHKRADATTTVVANPLLNLTALPALTNLNLGDSFEYVVKIKNIGSLNLNGVVLSNQIPVGLSIDWVGYGRGSCEIEASWLLWSVGNLATNASALMNVTATAVANGTWTNMFSLTDADGAASSTATEIIQVGAFGPPALAIAIAGQQVVLSWPQSAANYALQSATNFAPSGAWSPVTNAAAMTNGQNSVTLPAAARQQFFRLSSE